MDAPDKLGQTISPGCYIIYAIRRSNIAILKVGKVTAIKPCNDFYGRPGWAITAVSVDDSYHFQPKRRQRKVTLRFPARMVVIPESVVPEEYKDLLRGGYDVQPDGDVVRDIGV